MVDKSLEGFLDDNEVRDVTAHVRAGLSGSGICIWYKSPSLVENTDTHNMCHKICDGYGHGCNYAMYITRESKGNNLDVAKGNYD